MPLAAGDRLGPYEILGLVGTGGMGAVYRARDPRLGRDVAVKVISTEGAPSAERLTRFEDEARAVASLSHPNVLAVFDVGVSDARPYVVLELLEGEILRERLRGGPLPLRSAVETAVQVCRGLQAAHARGILHRDLKPENVFLTSDGFVKILDFGLAKLTRGEGAEAGAERTQTAAGVVMGTVGYLSPEQARGQEADARSDIFALGAILYEALSGKRAFAGESAADTISAILHEDPPPVRTVSGPLPTPVERVVRRCLEKEPQNRFDSAHDLALALEAVLEGPPAGVGEPEEAEARSPYPGLSAFAEGDSGRFFGREAEVEALWQRIRGRRLVALIGPSGAGKTSFVRAGVVASRPAGWAAVVTTPGSSPQLTLGQALASELQGDVDALRQLVRFEDPNAVFDVLSRWRKAHAQALLVVDQFEELFTLCSPEAHARFATLLGRLAEEAGIHVLISVRDDFLMRCHDHAALRPVFADLTPLGPLTGEALRRALEEPARAEGFRFEEGLVAKMTAAVEGERGALPLVAFAVSRLWEGRDRDGKRLTHEAYAEIGGVAGALARHAEATLERIGPGRQGIVREVFRNLVTAEGTRAAMDRDELLSVFPDRRAAEEVLAQLVSARLLTSWELPIPEDGNGAGTSSGRHRVEIVHEALLRSWLRLVRWQAQDAEGALLRDQLRQAAHLWEEKGRPADLLWSGTSFREYALWRERYPGQLTALEEDYAKAMVERARRRRRLRRGAVAAAFLVLAGVSTSIALLRHQAAKARDQARAEALRAEASRLVALAQLRLADDPTEALAYATASLELADTPEARVFVMKALWEAPPSFTLPVGPPPQRVTAFSPDGTRLAATGHDPVQLLWNESGSAPTPLDGHEISQRGSNVAGWSADGHLVTGLCCSLAAKVHVWSAEGKRLRTIEFGAPTSWQVGKEHVFGETEAGSPGRRALTLRSWRLRDGEAKLLGRVARSVRGPSVPSAFLPDGTGWAYARGSALFVRPLAAGTVGGERLVGRHGADIDLLSADERARDRLTSRDKTGETRVWRPVPGRLDPDRIITRPATAPPSVFSVELRWVHGNAWTDKKVRLWDLEALPGSRPLELRRSGSWYLAWPGPHPGGDWLAVFQAREGRAAFWPLRKPYPSVVDGYTPVHRPVAFSPEGRWLATSWADSKLRLWPLPGTGPREPRTLELPETSNWTNIVFDPHGRYVFAVGGMNRAWIVPLDGSPPRRLPVYTQDTVLFAAAASPSGRRVATAWNYGPGPKTLRVHDVETGETRVLPLPTEAANSRFLWEVYAGAVDGMGFLDETTVYTSGWAGLRRWDLEKGTSELMAADIDLLGFFGPDRRLALTGAPMPGREATTCRQLQTRDLLVGETKAVGPPGVCVSAPPAAVAGEVFAVPGPDGVLVGRLSGDAAHLLVGHAGTIDGVAVSPDGRWVATSGEDNTLRLWPMPDLAQPPLHTLPHDALVAKLRSLTNLRVVRPPESPTGWKIELAPFPGWRDVPTW